MTYAPRQAIRTSRTAAVVIVAMIHVALGYALVTGLAYTTIERAVEQLKTFDVEEAPPLPPEEPPPPPPETVAETPPPIVAPPPIVRTRPAPPPVTAVRQAPPPVVTPTAPPPPPAPVVRKPPPPPPPPPVKTVPPRSAVGDLPRLFSPEDYPNSAVRRDEQGTVSVVLTVGTNGRVTKCAIAGSSGSRALDNATCQILTSRAKFNPATDNYGKPVVDTVRQRIRWQLADSL